LIGELTVAEISRMYNVPESMVRHWRREAIKHMRDGFNEKNSSNKTGSCDSEGKIAMLERKVGQLTLGNDFLKKNTRSI
jgi:transposase-like protein